MVSLTHHIQIPPRNLIQATYPAHHAHIYVSLLGYLVPHHHLLTHLLHVYLRLCSRVVLGGGRGRKEEVWSNGVWLCTFHSVHHDTTAANCSLEHVYEHKLTLRPFLSFCSCMLDQLNGHVHLQGYEIILLVHWQDLASFPGSVQVSIACSMRFFICA